MPEKIITNDGKRGGWLVGKSHREGGIKAIVVDTGKPIELEGEEVIITKEAAKKHWKALSEINQDGGGVPIAPPNNIGWKHKAAKKLLFGGNIGSEYFKNNINDVGYKWKLSTAKAYEVCNKPTGIELGDIIEHKEFFLKYPNFYKSCFLFFQNHTQLLR
jgi:hypothetical protein